jgi:C4-dicarboxylate-specific signal transduction histidine kinase
MNHAELRKIMHDGRWRHLFGCLLLVGVALTGLALAQFRLQLNELERESTDLHRSASQLVGQHDAHLTALSAIAVASAGQRPDLFLEVGAAISRFYPRIEHIYLVPLDPSEAEIGSGPLTPELADGIRRAAGRSRGVPELLPHPARTGHYLLVKRSPNSDAARYALALDIDAAQLAASETAFGTRGNAQARLMLPTGEPLVGDAEATEAHFTRSLDSASQPLVLETRMPLHLSDLLPPGQVLVVVMLVGLVYLAVLVGLRQRARIRTAEHEAELRKFESQLTHAARVNSLGEMASGMAHELTQPLTAILAQLQAGQRLLTRGETGLLGPVFKEAIEQSRRSAAILERLRNWSRPTRGAPETIDLRAVLNNVRALLASEAERKQAAIRIDTPRSAVLVVADQVEMEQVIHNLVRNALEAQDGQQNASVDIRLQVRDRRAVIEIEDNGPGIDESILPTLFAPFTTTRADGTGLGLALSQRLVERAGGEISHVPGQSGAVFRVVMPIAGPAEEAAQ